jgi:hypothetical protein
VRRDTPPHGIDATPGATLQRRRCEGRTCRMLSRPDPISPDDEQWRPELRHIGEVLEDYLAMLAHDSLLRERDSNRRLNAGSHREPTPP